MIRTLLEGADLSAIDTPAFVIDEGALAQNLEILDSVQRASGATILLALKGFATWSTFPQIRKTLKGVSASSPHEARLGREEFGGQVHTYSPAFSESDLRACLTLSDHVIFNSISQLQRFRSIVSAHPNVEVGLRINPEHSEVATPLYDPCAPGSRLGVTRDQLDSSQYDHIRGLHFHSLCELGADALERTLKIVESKFADALRAVEWVNFGGGHFITHHDYDRKALIELIRAFRSKYKVDVYLEPGSAVALNAGVLVTSVLDLVRNGETTIAILDSSATAHMPDVLEMPYRPALVGGDAPGVKPHTYRLGGTSCLAGDVIGDWSFEAPLEVGQKLVFLDMAHYTMVKTSNFNGVRLPDIGLYNPQRKDYRRVKRFGYESYRDRLS